MRTAEEYLTINGILIDRLKEKSNGQLYKAIISSINFAREEAIREAAELVAPYNAGAEVRVLRLINQIK